MMNLLYDSDYEHIDDHGMPWRIIPSDLEQPIPDWFGTSSPSSLDSTGDTFDCELYKYSFMQSSTHYSESCNDLNNEEVQEELYSSDNDNSTSAQHLQLQQSRKEHHIHAQDCNATNYKVKGFEHCTRSTRDANNCRTVQFNIKAMRNLAAAQNDHEDDEDSAQENYTREWAPFQDMLALLNVDKKGIDFFKAPYKVHIRVDPDLKAKQLAFLRLDETEQGTKELTQLAAIDIEIPNRKWKNCRDRVDDVKKTSDCTKKQVKRKSKKVKKEAKPKDKKKSKVVNQKKRPREEANITRETGVGEATATFMLHSTLGKGVVNNGIYYLDVISEASPLPLGTTAQHQQHRLRLGPFRIRAKKQPNKHNKTRQAK